METMKTMKPTGGVKLMAPDMTMAGMGYNGPYPGVTHQDGSLPPQRPDMSPRGTDLGLTCKYAPDTQVD
jgi:hypothetical protein